MRETTRTAAGRSDNSRLHYEEPAIDTPLTLLSAAAVVAMVVLSCLASREIYSALVRPAIDRSSTPLYGEGLILPAEPRLEGIEMMSAIGTATNSAADEDRLQSYGWIDREKKIVRIPIQKAMELAIDQGWLRSTAAATDDHPKPMDNSKPAEESRSAR